MELAQAVQIDGEDTRQYTQFVRVVDPMTSRVGTVTYTAYRVIAGGGWADPA